MKRKSKLLTLAAALIAVLPVLQTSVLAQSEPGIANPAKLTPAPARVGEPVVRERVRLPGPKLPVQAGCPDPAVTNVLVRGISRDAPNVYGFVLTGIIGNEGADYRSAEGQQLVYVHKLQPGTPARLVKTQGFGNLNRGGRVQVLHRVLAWNTTTEFPADFEFQIAYDPDILRDGNPANDDCRAANNRRRITGAEINAAIRASGR
jgi:hypothetical protein